jgi:hypothetical protein
MNTTTPLHRRTPAITGIAALGLVTTVMLAPAAHADTELDRPEGSPSTAVVADVDDAAGAAGGETAAEAAPEAVAGTGEDVALSGETAPEAGDELLDAEAAPAAADPAGETATTGNAEQDDLCVDGAADGTTGDQQGAETSAGAPTATDLGDVTAEEGADGAAGLPEAASSGEGTVTDTVTDPGCAATTPDQGDNAPGTRDGDETQLPVGGVDAGRGEAVSQNMVLPIATAGAVAAAVGLGAYTLVRRRRGEA